MPKRWRANLLRLRACTEVELASDAMFQHARDFMLRTIAERCRRR